VGRVPGRVVGRSKREGWVDVLTGDAVLRLIEVRPDRGSAGPAAEWIVSTRQTLGLSRKQLFDRLTLLEQRVTDLERRLREASARPPAERPTQRAQAA
jgi:hypothetical protein